MPLRTKVLLIIGAVLISYALLANGILNWVIYPGFVNMEQNEVIRNLERGKEALNREIHHLDSLCYDWGAWDDTYEFAGDENPEYIQRNLMLATFQGNELNTIYILNTKNELVWGKTYDLETEEELEIPDLPKDTWPASHPLLNYRTDKQPLPDISISGIFMTAIGPMLVCSRPIITSDEQGPPNGTIIMGKFLNENLVEILMDQTKITFYLHEINSPDIPEIDQSALEEIGESDNYNIKERNDELIQAYAVIKDIMGTPALLYRVDVSRNITSKGREVISVAIYSIMLLGLLVLIVLIFILQRTVLGPLTKLTEHAIKIGKSNDLSERIKIDSKDEIGTLSNEFNKMIEQLSDARSKLLEQSYQSGLAEMASGILHNIRNTLNPITEGIDSLSSKTKTDNFVKIKTALEELKKGCESPERENALRKYVELSSANLLEILEEAEKELRELSGHLGKIEEILSEQDSISHLKKVIEPIDTEKTINNAVSRLQSQYSDKIEIRIDTDLKEFPQILAEEITFTRIMETILANSAKSIFRTPQGTGSINISLSINSEEENDKIHIVIEDSGEGYDSAAIERLFSRNTDPGESTKAGSGLHWCANIISTMKGRIFIESEGPGKGARTNIIVHAAKK